MVRSWKTKIIRISPCELFNVHVTIIHQWWNFWDIIWLLRKSLLCRNHIRASALMIKAESDWFLLIIWEIWFVIHRCRKFCLNILFQSLRKHFFWFHLFFRWIKKATFWCLTIICFQEIDCSFISWLFLLIYFVQCSFCLKIICFIFHIVVCLSIIPTYCRSHVIKGFLIIHIKWIKNLFDLMIIQILKIATSTDMKSQVFHFLQCKIIISLSICTCIDKIEQFFFWCTTFFEQFYNFKMCKLGILLDLFTNILGDR